MLCSGQGTNLQAILNAIRAGRLRARVALVVSDRADAFALTRAQRAGVPAHHVDPKRFANKAEFERAVTLLLDSHRVELVVLAGYMRILSPAFVQHFQHRILNIHPALLPAFPGGRSVVDALEWGAKVTGVTVHLVDEQVDHGPILLQEAVAIREGDTLPSLLARVHRVEHRLYPRAIQLVLDGHVRVDGRVARVTSKGSGRARRAKR